MIYDLPAPFKIFPSYHHLLSYSRSNTAPGLAIDIKAPSISFMTVFFPGVTIQG